MQGGMRSRSWDSGCGFSERKPFPRASTDLCLAEVLHRSPPRVQVRVAGTHTVVPVVLTGASGKVSACVVAAWRSRLDPLQGVRALARLAGALLEVRTHARQSPVGHLSGAWAGQQARKLALAKRPPGIRSTPRAGGFGGARSMLAAATLLERSSRVLGRLSGKGWPCIEAAWRTAGAIPCEIRHVLARVATDAINATRHCLQHSLANFALPPNLQASSLEKSQQLGCDH